jgi:hypothetical protein
MVPIPILHSIFLHMVPTLHSIWLHMVPILHSFWLFVVPYSIPSSYTWFSNLDSTLVHHSAVHLCSVKMWVSHSFPSGLKCDIAFAKSAFYSNTDFCLVHSPLLNASIVHLQVSVSMRIQKSSSWLPLAPTNNAFYLVAKSSA